MHVAQPLPSGPSPPRPPRVSSSHLLTQWGLARLARAFRGVPVRLELWDGSYADFSTAEPVATVRVRDRATLLNLTMRPAVAFGEAYAAGRIVVDGDLVPMLVAVNQALAARPYPGRSPREGRITPARARHNVHAHYDIGNDFYRLWLDETMAYTCAYFTDPEATLERAQQAKLEYVCRKLQLRPGDHVIEAGCGWGALALHMARTHGVTVSAYNVSASQLAFARAEAVRAGLADRVTFVNDDYRAIAGRADAFVSIGMLEHVGREQYPELGRAIDRVLDPARGRGLLHFIGRDAPMPFNAWIAEYIFPGAYAPALSEVLSGVLEPCGLSVFDVENLRPHYARTLTHWLDRFEARADRVQKMFDEAFVRTWRLYLASAAACFLSGSLQLFQVTFGRPADDSRPWTRDVLYRRRADGSL
jgi:cyclopropane-fatty-acyl-phospholipid synthase